MLNVYFWFAYSLNVTVNLIHIYSAIFVNNLRSR